MILNYLKTSYSKHQKLALWTKAQSLVLFITALHTSLVNSNQYHKIVFDILGLKKIPCGDGFEFCNQPCLSLYLNETVPYCKTNHSAYCTMTIFMKEITKLQVTFSVKGIKIADLSQNLKYAERT